MTDPAMELVRMCEWLGGLQKELRIQRSNDSVAQVLDQRFRIDQPDPVHPFIILRTVERRFDDFLLLVRAPEFAELHFVDSTLISAGISAVASLRAPLQLDKVRDSWNSAASHMTKRRAPARDTRSLDSDAPSLPSEAVAPIGEG